MIYGEKAVSLLPMSKEAYRGSCRLQDLAKIYTLVGEYEKALDNIEYLLDRPTKLTVHLLRLHPIWEPLRANPRFKKILEKYSS